MTNKLDYDCLKDFFSIEVDSKPKRKRKEPIYQDSNGNVANIQQVHSREWEGWFDHNHSVTYVAETKRELIADMQVVRTN